MILPSSHAVVTQNNNRFFTIVRAPDLTQSPHIYASYYIMFLKVIFNERITVVCWRALFSASI
jgi:hypothetical protein